MGDFVRAISAYNTSLQLAGRHGWWSFVWIPIAVSILVGVGLAMLIIYAAPPISQTIEGWYPWDTAKSLISVTVAVLTALIILSLGVLLFKYLVLIIAFPFMSFLSQRVEKSLYGSIEGYEGGQAVSQFFKEIIRGVGISTRLIFWEILWVVLLLLLSLIPGMAIITGPAIFLVHSYFAGCVNMDYTLERYYGIPASIRFMRHHFWMTLGNGFVFMLIFSIPVLGIFLSPVWGTMAASISTLDLIRGAPQTDHKR